MTITLYHTSDDPLTVFKTTDGTATTTSATVRGPLDILRPVLAVQQTVKLSTHNYVEIPDLNRVYFITDISIDRTGFSILTCECDYLSSHAAALMNCRCVVDRADTLNDSEIVDSRQRFKANQDIECFTVHGLGMCYPERVIMVCNT